MYYNRRKCYSVNSKYVEVAARYFVDALLERAGSTNDARIYKKVYFVEVHYFGKRAVPK